MQELNLYLEIEGVSRPIKRSWRLQHMQMYWEFQPKEEELSDGYRIAEALKPRPGIDVSKAKTSESRMTTAMVLWFFIVSRQRVEQCVHILHYQCW